MIIETFIEFADAQFRQAFLGIPLQNPLSYIYVIINFIALTATGGIEGLLGGILGGGGGGRGF